MKTTSEQRRAMIGKSFLADMNSPVEFSVTVHDIERCGGGFTVKYTTSDCKTLQYEAFQRFLKRFPHEV